MSEALDGVVRRTRELVRRGWTEDDLLKLAGRNHLRAMRQMEKVAADLQKTTPPSVTDGPRLP